MIAIPIPGDDPYYVTVDRKKVGKGKKKLVCKADTSPSVPFPPFF